VWVLTNDTIQRFCLLQQGNTVCCRYCRPHPRPLYAKEPGKKARRRTATCKDMLNANKTIRHQRYGILVQEPGNKTIRHYVNKYGKFVLNANKTIRHTTTHKYAVFVLHGNKTIRHIATNTSMEYLCLIIEKILAILILCSLLLLYHSPSEQI